MRLRHERSGRSDNRQPRTSRPDHGPALLIYSLLPLALFAALVAALVGVPLPWRLEAAWVPSLGVEPGRFWVTK